MRILLAHNSLYYPSFGGGDKSNRLLMEALAARGHVVRVIARVERFAHREHERLRAELAARGVAVEDRHQIAIFFELNGVEVHVLTGDSHLRAYLQSEIEGFDPDVVLTSTDDPAHLMLDIALRSRRARVVYMIRATIALPFGPDASFPSDFKTAALRHCDGVVAVSNYVADYGRKWGGLDALHVPISLLDSGKYPMLGRRENRFVTLINPCAVKGLSIFLGLADALPHIQFAAVPTWGTTPEDLVLLGRRPNVTIWSPIDNIVRILRETKILLVPSIWAEARSRMILEGMAHGIPVLASDVGGLSEAKLGVDYLLPVHPVVHYRAEVDSMLVPCPEIPPQDIKPWQTVVERLIADPAEYARVSQDSRRAALEYAATLTAAPFEEYLKSVAGKPRRREMAMAAGAAHRLSPDKARLLALRLKQRRHP